METENTEKIREHIRNQSPQFLKLMNIYLIGHRNRACPKVTIYNYYSSYYINYNYYFNFNLLNKISPYIMEKNSFFIFN